MEEDILEELKRTRRIKDKLLLFICNKGLEEEWNEFVRTLEWIKKDGKR